MNVVSPRSNKERKAGGKLTNSQVAVVLIKSDEIHGHFEYCLSRCRSIVLIQGNLRSVGDTPLRAIAGGGRSSNTLPVTGHTLTCLARKTKLEVGRLERWRREAEISARSWRNSSSERSALGPHLVCPPPTEFLLSPVAPVFTHLGFVVQSMVLALRRYGHSTASYCAVKIY